ncbi:MAG: site-2 protease family protein [Chloroflexota bacterium]|nr:site-2 protease family protein [Chloroflexota bacterium]
MPSTDLIAAVIVIAVMLLVAFPIHEFAHALAAYRLGDGTAKMFGRLTLNPIAHFDPIGGILLTVSVLASAASSAGFFAFGWAKPTPVNPMNLRNGRYGEAIVAFAGPASNLILAAAAAIPLRFLYDHPELVQQVGLVFPVLRIFVLLNLVLMLFNLVPIPPLDGSKVLFAFLSPRTVWQWRPILEQYGFLILILLFFFPPGASIGARIFGPILSAIFGFLVGA